MRATHFLQVILILLLLDKHRSRCFGIMGSKVFFLNVSVTKVLDMRTYQNVHNMLLNQQN
jgi:hypothetical protein